jgi:hypothetical protein
VALGKWETELLTGIDSAGMFFLTDCRVPITPQAKTAFQVEIDAMYTSLPSGNAWAAAIEAWKTIERWFSHGVSFYVPDMVSYQVPGIWYR